MARVSSQQLFGRPRNAFQSTYRTFVLKNWCGWILALTISGSGWLLAAEPKPNPREVKVRGDIAKFENDENWVYNDWDKAVSEARRTGKPLMVIVRCVPCEACSKFDDQLVRRVDEVRDLMDRFVCVRIITCNGLDLNLFQFDYDQSFHCFLMNADLTIYGRFGTRSENEDETQDMTMQGFRRALQLALDWHGKYPQNKALFAGKRGGQPLVSRPEQYATLSGKYKSELDYQGNVVQSCIHCHQVREAERAHYRAVGKSWPENVLYPHPLPKVIGLQMNALEAAEVHEVLVGSPAATAGFRSGDRIRTLGGQPILSIADLQWVLHQAASPAELAAEVERQGQLVALKLRLPEHWRSKSDLSWRVTTWDLRRMAFGGLALETLPDSDRAVLQIPANSLALRLKHVGQYGDHARAKQAGFVQGDVLVEIDGSRTALTETELLAANLTQRKPGAQIPVKVLRKGQEIALKMPVQ